MSVIAGWRPFLGNGLGLTDLFCGVRIRQSAGDRIGVDCGYALADSLGGFDGRPVLNGAQHLQNLRRR